MVQSLRVLCFLLLLPGCQSERPGTEKDPVSVDPPTTEAGLSKDCIPDTERLAGNRIVQEDLKIALYIIADSTTYDRDYGPSHRVLLVYQLPECKLLDRQILPIAVSPDYPYRFADRQYNRVSHMVGLWSNHQFFCYDLSAQQLFGAMVPRYPVERPLVDAQSGQILHLELWETYLMGTARDFGSFAYQIPLEGPPEPLLPLAEYENGAGNRYHSLFLLPVDEGYQVIIPHYEAMRDSFSLRPLFDQPVPLLPNSAQQSSSDRYLVVQDEIRQAIAIDLAEEKLVDLPRQWKTKPVAEILNWLEN